MHRWKPPVTETHISWNNLNVREQRMYIQKYLPGRNVLETRLSLGRYFPVIIYIGI